MKGRPHHTTELVTPHQEDACFFIYDDGKKQVYFFIKMTKMIERFAGLVPVGGNCRPNASRLLSQLSCENRGRGTECDEAGQS